MSPHREFRLSLDEAKARLARSFAAELPDDMPVREKAERIVDGLIGDVLVGTWERDEWLRKVVADLERTVRRAP